MALRLPQSAWETLTREIFRARRKKTPTNRAANVPQADWVRSTSNRGRSVHAAASRTQSKGDHFAARVCGRTVDADALREGSRSRCAARQRAIMSLRRSTVRPCLSTSRRLPRPLAKADLPHDPSFFLCVVLRLRSVVVVFERGKQTGASRWRRRCRRLRRIDDGGR
jgi:hypothetical protein